MTRAIFSWKGRRDASSDPLDPGRSAAAAARWPSFATRILYMVGRCTTKSSIKRRSRSMRSASLFCDSFSRRRIERGQHDRGRGEQGDVRAALDFLASEFPSVPLLVAGFSFGCVVGFASRLQDSRVSLLIGLGVPVNNEEVSFLSKCSKPKLFAHGKQRRARGYRKGENTRLLVAG